MKQKKSNKKYELGSYVKPMSGKNSLGDFSGLAAMGGNLLGSAIGGEGGNILSGIGSGASAGMALGPLGMAGGAALGAIGSILGNKAEEKRLMKQQKAEQASFNTAYQQQLASGVDTVNENPYGQVFANGGLIDPTTGYGAYNQKTAFGTTGRKQMSPQELEYITKKTGLKDTQFKDNLPVIEKYLTQFRSGTEPVGTPQPDRNNAFTMNADGTRNAGVYNHKMGMFNYAKYAEGAEVLDNRINIEKGELQIDPATGKILREYTGMNPETGGLYKEHSKGKDPVHNLVTAEPGTFVITKAKAKEYKDAILNNDKLHQNSILQNIKNYKEDKTPNSKMALGGFTDPLSPWDQISQNNQMIMRGQTPGVLSGSPITANTGYQAPRIGDNLNLTQPQLNTGVSGTQVQGSNILGQIGQGIGTYGNALFNIGQGMFGKVDKVNQVGVTQNPYKQDILNNMPQDINFEPIRQQLLRREQGMFNQIDNSTSASPVARANKQNLFANTQNQLGNLLMDNQVRNNQVRGQRANIYSGLGSQQMNETNRAQQINLGIDEQNRANQGAKQNMLSTGLTQLQQAYQNNRANNSKQAMDKYKVELLRQMFPNLKYYGSQFGEEALNNLIG